MGKQKFNWKKFSQAIASDLGTEEAQKAVARCTPSPNEPRFIVPSLKDLLDAKGDKGKDAYEKWTYDVPKESRTAKEIKKGVDAVDETPSSTLAILQLLHQPPQVQKIRVHLGLKPKVLIKAMHEATYAIRFHSVFLKKLKKARELVADGRESEACILLGLGAEDHKEDIQRIFESTDLSLPDSERHRMTSKMLKKHDISVTDVAIKQSLYREKKRRCPSK